MPPDEKPSEDEKLISVVEGVLSGMDKRQWGPGPWQDEPDYSSYVFFGYRCYARRNTEAGHWCGYIEIPPEHPWYIVGDYESVNSGAHGGFTFYGRFLGVGNGWYLGFDCGHAGDYSPSRVARTGSGGQSLDYKTLSFVRNNLEEIARRAYAAAPSLQP